MSFSGFIVQLINGLASASSLFLVAAGLSLIFGVTRVVNFAHGSFFMVGIYVAYSLVERLSGALGFWVALPLAALIVGVLGALIEVVLLRRIYKAPELFQLLATFALVLVIKDAVLWLWGPDELLGPRAPGLSGSVSLLGRQFPSYDLFLIVVGPLVLGAVWLLLTRTRIGLVIQAALTHPEMAEALGHNVPRVFMLVFGSGCALAGLAGVIGGVTFVTEPNMANIGPIIFAVIVIGGMGSLSGAFVGSLVVGLLQTLPLTVDANGVDVFRHLGLAIGPDSPLFPLLRIKLSETAQILPYLMLVLILIFRPKGLLGTREG